MTLDEYIFSQSMLMDDIMNGTAQPIDPNKKEDDEEMGKLKRSNTRKRDLSLSEIVDLIRPDVLKGLDKKAISKRHHIDISRVVKAMEVLNHDAEVMQMHEAKIEKMRAKNKNQDTRDKELDRIKDEVVKEEPQQDEPTKKVPHVFSDEDKLKMVEDYETGEYTQAQLSAKYGVSKSTVCRVINMLLSAERVEEIKNIILQKNASTAEKVENEKIKKETAKETEEVRQEAVEEEAEVEKVENVEVLPSKKSEENTEEKDIPVVKKYATSVAVSPLTSIATSDDIKYPSGEILKDLVEVNTKDTYKTVGLINNRHNLGVNTYIFDNIPRNKVLEFDWLEKVCKDFIDNNIKFNKYNVPMQGLIVKCTGLQSALTSLIKVCYQKKVNLIISHYQIDRDVDLVYRQQPIFTEFSMATNVPYTLTHISNTSGKLFLFRSQISDYFVTDQFFEISVSNNDPASRFAKDKKAIRPINTYSVLTKTLEECMICSALMSKSFNLDRTYYRSMIIRQYDADSRSDIGYSSCAIQRSYF